MHHDTQTRRLDDRLRTTKRLEIVFARNRAREPGFDTDDEVAMPFDCFARGCDVHAADVHELAIGQNAGPRDVQENADTVRRGLRDRYDIVNAIGAL